MWNKIKQLWRFLFAPAGRIEEPAAEPFDERQFITDTLTPNDDFPTGSEYGVVSHRGVVNPHFSMRYPTDKKSGPLT